MSCEACEEAQTGAERYYFRWKNANVLVMGCEKHVEEIFEVLRAAQGLGKS